MSVTLFHYTNEAGKDGIYANKFIEAREPVDCSSQGKGVYFTEIPFTDRAAVLENNYGHQSAGKSDRARFWFKFQLSDLPDGTVQLTNVGNRNIWKCPINVPIKPKIILYHYTDTKGKEGIDKCGYIKAQLPHKGEGLGGKMPTAVYFTELHPEAPKEELLFNMFATSDTSNTEFVDKTKHHYWFYKDEIPNVRKRKTQSDRNEWISDQDVQLTARHKRTITQQVSIIESTITSGEEALNDNICSECKTVIRGLRFMCLECRDYNLCTKCSVTNNKHPGDYMLRFGSPVTQERAQDLFKNILLKITKYKKLESTQKEGGLYHKKIVCKGCETTTPKGLKGDRFKCLGCEKGHEYDLCSTCIERECHKEHTMLRISKPSIEKVLKSIYKVYNRT